jgi:hypothetical protein
VRCNFQTDAYPASELNEKPRFSVVVVYEDRLTGVRAKHFYDSLTEEVEEECDFSLQLWNFQVLANSEISNSAAQAAARADFVILSLRGRVGLPAEIKGWVETWSRLIANRNAALIVLTNKPRSNASTAASTLTYLESVADRKRIAFFPHTAFSPARN